jgi:hypothetical protein
MMQSSDPPVKPRAMQVCFLLVRLLLLSVVWLVLLIGVAWAFGSRYGLISRSQRCVDLWRLCLGCVRSQR